MIQQYNAHFSIEMQEEILEKVIKHRKTRDRPKGLTNPVLRNNFSILREKYALWGLATRAHMHDKDLELIRGIEPVIDEFLKLCKMYLTAHGVIRPEVEELDEVEL